MVFKEFPNPYEDKDKPENLEKKGDEKYKVKKRDDALSEAFLRELTKIRKGVDVIEFILLFIFIFFLINLILMILNTISLGHL